MPVPQIVKVIANVPGLGTNSPLVHSLIRQPSIHLLGVGTDPAVSRGLTPDGTNLYHTNSNAAAKPVVALTIAPHSLMLGAGAWINAIQGVTGSIGAQTRAHGLIANGVGLVPDIIFVEFGTDPLISGNPITADGTNISFGIGGNAAGMVYGFLAVALHSEWGVGQWKNIVTGQPSPIGGNYGQIASLGSNVAFPHGLSRAPNVIMLGARCGAGVSIGATTADATNIYLSNSVAALRNVEALAIAGHSIIA